MTAFRRTAQVVRIVEWAWVTLVVVVAVTFAASLLAGWKLRSVDSASMSPTVPKGSLAVVVPVTPGDVEVGDIVIFDDPGRPGITVMHRVVDEQTSREGTRFLQTQGDANRTPDPLLVAAPTIEGRVTRHVPRLGALAAALRSPVGLAALVGVPLALAGLGSILDRRAGHRDVTAGSPDEPSDTEHITRGSADTADPAGTDDRPEGGAVPSGARGRVGEPQPA